MQSRRRFVLVIAATLAVAGATGFLAPTVSASPSTAGALDSTGTDAPAGATGRLQPELPPPERWNRTYGAAPGDLTAAAIDDRGFVATGTVLTDGGTSNSGWVVAVDRAGDVRFEETYAEDGEGRFTDVVPTPDGGYLLAGTLDSGNTAADDGWVLKLDATGSVVWQGTFGGAGDDEFAAIQPTDDGYLLAGTTGGGGDSDGWLVKLDTGGRLQWDGSYDNDFDDVVRDIEPHPAGGYLLAGETTAFVGARTDGWTVHVEADGSELTQRTYGGERADGFRGVETLAGDVLLAGESNTYGTADRRGWVLRRGPNGTERWNRTFDVDETAALAVTERGFVLAGIETTDAGIRDGVVLGSGTEGVDRWRRAYGGANDDLFSDVVVGPDGGYLVAGTSYSGPRDGTGWLVTLGTVLATPRPTPTGEPADTTTVTSTAPPATGTTTSASGAVTTASRSTRATAGGAVSTADGAATTTTNASAAGGGGSFPWTIIALLLILAVLGGVILALRSQQVGGGDDGYAPSPPGGDDPTFGSPSGGSSASDEPPQSTSRGTPRDPDPLGTNARSPAEATTLFLTSIATRARETLPFLESPRENRTDDSPEQVPTAGTDATGEAGAGGEMESGPVDAGTSAEPATEGGETSTTNDELPAASEDATTQAADGAADEGVAAGTAQGGSAGAAAAGATVPAGEGSPGTFTLRNPGDEKVVVAFRCQTADETLFNYYAEVPPATIKRAKKLPATDRFEISISITDGPSESRRFENGGPNGQDVTVTVSPDTIGMEAESDDQQSDTTIEGTVEPRGESTEAGDGAPAASDDAPLEGDDAATDSTTADADSASGDGTDEREATDEQAESAVSDDPGDVLPNADSDSSGSVVSEDPDDVLPGVDEGADDGEQDAVAADSDPADEGESTGETTRAGTESEADGSADSSDSGSGFQALKEEFDSDEADWDDETSGSDGADDGEDLGGLDLGNPDGTGESDDDLGDIDEDVDDGAGDTEAADDSGSDDAGGGDDGDRSFAELKEEFESGDADWADEDEED